MLFFKIVIYFLSYLIPGLLLSWLLTSGRQKISWFNLALAYGLGSALITISLFVYLFFFQAHFQLWLGWLIVLGEILVLLFLIIRQKAGPDQVEWRLINRIRRGNNCLRNYYLSLSIGRKMIMVLLVVFSLINFWFLGSNVITRPIATFDSLATWSLKAKILFYQSEISFDPASPLYLGGGGHINYPWQIPLSQFWLQANLGTYNDVWPNLIFLGYFLALLIIVFHFLKKYSDIFLASIFSFFVFSMPLVFYHAFNAYADLPLAFYLMAALGFFGLWLEDDRRHNFYLSAIFWGLSFYIKDIALVFSFAWLLVFIWLVVRKKILLKNFIKYLLVVFITALPILIFKLIYQQSFSNVAGDWSFQPLAIYRFLEAIFVSYSWNIWWFIVLTSLAVNFRRIISSSVLQFLWLFLGLAIIGLILLFSFSPAASYALDQTALSRSLMPLTIGSVLTVGWSFGKNKQRP